MSTMLSAFIELRKKMWAALVAANTLARAACIGGALTLFGPFTPSENARRDGKARMAGPPPQTELRHCAVCKSDRVWRAVETGRCSTHPVRHRLPVRGSGRSHISA